MVSIKYEPRSLGELINRNESWNINDFINFKSSLKDLSNYWKVKLKYKSLTIQHIQTL